MLIHEGHKLDSLLFMLMAFFVLIFHVYFSILIFPPLSPFLFSRLWSSWIPNFSRCLTWSKRTEPTGRNWTRRDNVARVCLRPGAPAVRTTQKRMAAPGPKRAAHPAVAPMPTAHHPNLLVSFWCRLQADLLGFFPVKCSLRQRQCSACRGSWALLPFAFATRDELYRRRFHWSFSAPFSLPALKADRAVFGKLVGAAANQPLTQCQKGNSNHCVNMSTSELTLTILGIAQISNTTRHEEILERNVCLCCGSFRSRYLLVARILPGVTEIFFVNLYIGYWVLWFENP